MDQKLISIYKPLRSCVFMDPSDPLTNNLRGGGSQSGSRFFWIVVVGSRF